jgi:DNA-binding GntR family transcriptional regulator
VSANNKSGILGAEDAPSVRNATSVAVDLIRAAILEGRIGPGERLKEETIARDLGLSRTPVREALLLLQGEGLVESSRNRGAVVRAYDASEIEEMYQLRALLEGYAARRAAELIQPAELRLLEESCERFSAICGDGEIVDLLRENFVFHTTILDAARSIRLAEMVRTVIDLPLVYKSFYWYSPEQRRMSERHHLQLLRALTAHDVERSELIMKEHVFEARDFLIANVHEVGTANGDPA